MSRDHLCLSGSSSFKHPAMCAKWSRAEHIVPTSISWAIDHVRCNFWWKLGDRPIFVSIDSYVPHNKSAS